MGKDTISLFLCGTFNSYHLPVLRCSTSNNNSHGLYVKDLLAPSDAGLAVHSPRYVY